MLEALLVRWTMPRQRSAIRGPSGSLGSEFRVIGIIGMSPASHQVSSSKWCPPSCALQGQCGFFIYENEQMKQADSMACLDTWSDEASASDSLRTLQTLRAVEFHERVCNIICPGPRSGHVSVVWSVWRQGCEHLGTL